MMDTSTTMDALNDTPSLPELSFDDLLDTSPVKRDTGMLDDPLELEHDRKVREDETLNTPRPKKVPPQQNKTNATTRTMTTNITTTAATTPASTFNNVALRTTAITATQMLGTTQKTTATAIATATATSTSTPTTATTAAIGDDNLNKATTVTTATTTTPGPVVLKSRNVLQKRVLKITPKLKISSGATTTGTATAVVAAADVGGVTTAATVGKTAVKTVNGQTFYIQKSTAGMPAVRLQAVTPTTAASASGATTTSTTTPAVTTAITPTNSGAGTVGNKTVAIQVIRAASNSTAASKAALTLSPNIASQLSGKRIITSSGGQVVLKAPLRPMTATTVATTTTVSKAISSTAAATATTATTSEAGTSAKVNAGGSGASNVSTTTASSVLSLGAAAKTAGKIVVQSANGKQIVVSNQHLIKLSPKPPSTVTVSGTGTGTGTSTGTVTTSAGATGQLQTIQLGGKSLQYVRVVPNAKLSGGSGTSTSNASTTVSTGGSTTTTSTIKIVPQTFTMVRPTNTTTAGKTLLTQSPRKEGGGIPVTFSPVTSKVKTIVTVPSLRTIADNQKSPSSSNNANSQSLMRTATTNASTTASSVAATNPPIKRKISEINSELQRMTSSNVDIGSPEPKKLPSGNRIVVVQRSMLRTTASGQQQQVTVQSASNNHNNANKNSNNQVSNSSGNQLETASNKKQLYSVLKSNNPPKQSANPTTSASSQLPTERKSLLIWGKSQAMLAHQQQQHKSLQLKYMQQQHQQQQQSGQQQQKPPAQTYTQKLPTLANSSTGKSSTDNNKFVPVKIKEEPLDSNDIKPLLENVGGAMRRKHCNCSKSQCLKLYCDCFANGEFCQNCTCKDCFNSLQYEDERQRAIKICLERNPRAFKPKITTSGDQGDMRLHNKGCNCKRSGCLKNYCECYEAKIPCSSNCKCLGCRNIEERPDLDMDPIDPKVLTTIVNASLSGAGQKRSYDKANSKATDKAMYKDSTKALAMGSDLLSAGMSSSGGNSGMGMGGASSTSSNGGPPAEKQQCNFITQEVVDATIQCMISQADECEKNGLPAYQTEKMVMEEMGRCLVEIIDFSIRNTDSSFTQD